MHIWYHWKGLTMVYQNIEGKLYAN